MTKKIAWRWTENKDQTDSKKKFYKTRKKNLLGNNPSLIHSKAAKHQT